MRDAEDPQLLLYRGVRCGPPVSMHDAGDRVDQVQLSPTSLRLWIVDCGGGGGAQGRGGGQTEDTVPHLYHMQHGVMSSTAIWSGMVLGPHRGPCSVWCHEQHGQ